jgi:hypothetical protein
MNYPYQKILNVDISAEYWVSSLGDLPSPRIQGPRCSNDASIDRVS